MKDGTRCRWRFLFHVGEIKVLLPNVTITTGHALDESASQRALLLAPDFSFAALACRTKALANRCRSV
jgi:hypothetical protein